MQRSIWCGIVLMGAAVGIAEAQPTFERGWIDVNIGIARAAEPAPDTIVATGRLFGETARFEVDYRNPTGASFDFGGGFLLTPRVGLGVSFSGTAHKDTAGLRARIPHPFISNAFGTDDADTDRKLERVEGAVHVQAVHVLPLRSDRVRVRVFGGPTFFRVQQDLVSDIRYEQVFLVFNPANQITITNYETRRVEETGWGYHVGGDVSLFFTRVIGVGGFARFSHGSVTIDDADLLSDDPIKLKAGGLQAGGGLRLKF